MYRIRKKRDGTMQRVNLTSHVLIYMDDIFITGTNTKDLHKAMKLIIKYCKNKLGLTIKNRGLLQHASLGIKLMIMILLI
mgnify:CR=1 FL=1